MTNEAEAFYEFDVELVQGVPLIRDGENLILVDTGTPQTLHTAPTLAFCGKTYHTPTQEAGYGSEAVARILGRPVTTKMGLDVLRDFRVLFDYGRGKITFSREKVDMEGVRLPLAPGGAPVFAGRMNGRDLSRIYIDSGAYAAYLDRPCPENLPLAGEVREGNPLYFFSRDNCWTTPVRRMSVELGSLAFDVRCGTLPSVGVRFLRASGVQGIFGFDFLSQFTVLFDFPSGVMVVAKGA